MKDRITKFLENSVTGEAVLKRIAFYLFLICVLLILIFFKLNEINNNFLNITEPILSSIKSEEKESVKDVFIDENDNIVGEVLPMYNELSESETDNTINNTTESTTKVKENSTENTTEAVTQQHSNSQKYDFVINTNSNKIHYVDCTFVGRMKEENKKYIQLSNDELNDYLNNGYTLCSTCGG
mgnify:CR=1 FL=1